MKNILLFVLLVAVLIIGFSIFTFTLYEKEIKRIENERYDDLSITTTTIANDLSFIFSSTEKDLKLLASIYSNKKVPSTSALSKIYDSIFDSNSFLLNIFFMNSEGTMKAIAPKIFKCEIGNNYAFRKYFQKAINNKSIVFSDVLSNFREKKNEQNYKSIIVVLPVCDDENNFKGILGANLDLNKIQKRIRAESLTKKMSTTGFYCIDYKNSTVVAGPIDRSNNQVFDKLLLSIAKSAFFDKLNDKTFTFNDKKYIFSSNVVSNINFTFQILGILPLNESIFSFKQIFKQIKGIVVMIVGVIIIVLFIILYNEKIHKKLKSRIRDLEINIDHKKTVESMHCITESDYFKQLQEKINSIKKD